MLKFIHEANSVVLYQLSYPGIGNMVEDDGLEPPTLCL
jgi:hypothetical protein